MFIESSKDKTIYNIKVVLLGDSGVGKTCILERYALNTYNAGKDTTTTATFRPKVLYTPDGKCEIQFLIWDTAGQETYHSLASFYYRDADIVFLVYDVTKQESYESLNFWINEVKLKGRNNCLITILGNKSDCIDKEVVKQENAEEFAKKHHAGFFKISAKDDINISNAFMNAVIRKYPMLASSFNYEWEQNGAMASSQDIKNKKEIKLNSINLSNANPKKGCGCG